MTKIVSNSVCIFNNVNVFFNNDICNQHVLLSKNTNPIKYAYKK